MRDFRRLDVLRLLLILSVIITITCCSLTGSDYKAKQISPQSEFSLRVMTYNIHIGKGMDGKLDLSRIAQVINEQEPDIAALQEVDRFTQRSNLIDDLKILEEMTGMNGIYGKTLDFQGGEYGIAVLTPHEVISSHHTLLPEMENKERRGFLTVVFQKNMKPVALINTHLGLDEEERAIQIQTILQAAEKVHEPLIIVGDFNCEPDTENWRMMNRGFVDSALQLNKTQHTYPADAPEKRIDYVWLRRSDSWIPVSCTTISTIASDHLPLIVDVE